MHIYEGTENYIFISYSHKDSARVMPILEGLYNANYRVWYDEGIEAGSEWPENVATHISKSDVVLIFLSQNALDSQNCVREIHFAIKKRKKILVIYLEDLELSDGMDMQLSTLQAMFLNKYESSKQFIEKLTAASILQSCQVTEPAITKSKSMPIPEETQTVAAPETDSSEATPAPSSVSYAYYSDWGDIGEGALAFLSLASILVGLFGLLVAIFNWSIPWIVWQWIIGIVGGGWLMLGLGALIYLLEDEVIADYYMSGFITLSIITLANVILFLCLRENYNILFSCFSVWSIIGGIILSYTCFEDVEDECGIGYIGASIVILLIMILCLVLV